MRPAGLEIPPGTERVLFQTRDSSRWAYSKHGFSSDFVALTEDGARWLVARGVRLVGIDGPSVASYNEGPAAHRALLSAGVVLVEGLNLENVAPGVYWLVCLPLRITGSEGAPARAILIDRLP